MFHSIFLILVTLTVSGFCYQCQNSIINPPSDLSQPAFYPAGWSEDQDPPTVSSGQNCMITINVPSGYFTNVTFYKNFPSSGGSNVLYSNNKIVQILNNDHAPFIFVSPNFKVNVQTSNSTDPSLFGFKIQWIVLPDAQKQVLNVYKGNPPVIVTPTDLMTIFVADSKSMMSVMAFSLVNSKMSNLLRQSVIYAGDSFNGTFIGTLDQVLTSKMPLITSRNRLSVYTFGLSNLIRDPLFMGQDTADVRNYTVYQGANCRSSGNCNITLDGSFGNSLTVTNSHEEEFIQSFGSFPDTVTLNIYDNVVDSEHLIGSLNSTNFQKQLPFEVYGNKKFYELIGHGVVNMIVTRRNP